jgi:hypothetical protein
MDNFTKVTKKCGSWSDHFVSKYEMVGVLFSTIYNKLDEVTIPIHSKCPNIVNDESLRFIILYSEFSIGICCYDIKGSDAVHKFTHKIKDKHINKRELWGLVNDYVRFKVIERLTCDGLIAEDYDYYHVL